MKFIDFFAGIGGFRRGMELAGHECVGFCEFDKFAVASYTAMHLMTDKEREYIATLPKNKRVAEAGKEEYRHGEWYANDIRRMFAEDIPRADCWCFGFPCQDISVAGKQLGFDGARSSLFFRVMRLVQDLEEKDRPAYLFIENVKNLLSVNGGADFLKLLLALDECGYDAEWQVINSADYVPQNRERVFIVGHLRGRGGAQIFPIEGADGENHIQQIGNFVELERRSNPSAGRIYAPEGIAPCLNAKGGGRQEPYIALPAFCDLSYGAGLQLYDKAFCLQARYHKGICNRRKEVSGICVPIEPPGALRTVRSEYGKQIRKDYESGKIRVSRHDFTEKTIREDGLTNTLSTVQKDNLLVVKVSDGMAYAVWNEKYQCHVAIRKLTPLECFRLQGWEDEYFHRAALVNSDSQLYRQAGNGVTVPVIYEIARRMGNG